jgi:glycosyltransferase involved in cell wall biosynthesis
LIRILHFAHIINRFDVVDTVLTRLDPSRFEVFALTGLHPKRGGEFTGAEQAYPTKTLGFDFNRSTYRRMYAALTEEVRRFRPHILHAHHFDESLVAAVVARRAGVPCFVMWRHYSDHIYFLTKGLKQKVYLALENWSNRRADFINVPTRDVEKILVERQGVPAAKVKVIPFGVDFGRYHTSAPDAPARIREALGLDGKYMILACCRLSPEKGLEHLFGALPEVRRRLDRPYRRGDLVAQAERPLDLLAVLGPQVEPHQQVFRVRPQAPTLEVGIQDVFPVGRGLKGHHVPAFFITLARIKCPRRSRPRCSRTRTALSVIPNFFAIAGPSRPS